MCLPALDADNRQPELAQAVVERRSHSARLKQDPPAARKFRQLGCDIGGCRRDLGFVDDPAGSGYDAKCASLPSRHPSRRNSPWVASSSNDEADAIRPLGRATDHYPMLKKSLFGDARFIGALRSGIQKIGWGTSRFSA